MRHSHFRSPLSVLRCPLHPFIRRTENGQRTTQLPPYIYLTDATRSDAAAAIPRLPAGSLVIIRDYDHPDRLPHAAHLVRLCRAHGHRALIAASPGLAARLRADGIHLPEHMAPRLPALRRAHPRWLISVAAHHRATLLHARKHGADLALLSPLFPTASHPEAPALGLLRFRALIRGLSLPVYPLGGITPRHLPLLAKEPIPGIAAVRLFDTPSSHPPVSKPIFNPSLTIC